MNFKEDFSKGDVVYLIRYSTKSRTEEIEKLTLRTVEKNYMVGCTDKQTTYCIGKDNINSIFKTLKGAKSHLKKLQKGGVNNR